MKSNECWDYYHSKIVGWLELRASDQGICSIDFLRHRPSLPASKDGSKQAAWVIDLAREQLDIYFSGKPINFSVPLDILDGTDFQRKVWNYLLEIPYGQTRSYAEVAHAIGIPRGARAVGLANKKNCIPIIIPCHRVIEANGGLGGYASGLERKKALLELEGIRILKIQRPIEQYNLSRDC